MQSLPKSYRTMEEFEREEIRPGFRIGFSIDDLEESSFEAEMAFLLMMLMIFHAIGALVFIPAMVSLLRPRFAVGKADRREVQLAVGA